MSRRIAWRIAVVLVAAVPALSSASAPVRVQNRLLQKDHHVFLTAGAVYLDRADYFASPGAALTASYYLREDDAVELFAAGFMSFSTPGAQEVFDQTGLVPDAHRPELLLLAGARHSLGYGKVLVGGTVLHFDVQIAGRAGALKTNRAWAPALQAAPGLIVRAGPRLFVQGELAGMASLEQRTRGRVAFGLMPSLSAGVRW